VTVISAEETVSSDVHSAEFTVFLASTSAVWELKIKIRLFLILTYSPLVTPLLPSFLLFTTAGQKFWLLQILTQESNPFIPAISIFMNFTGSTFQLLTDGSML